jgi:hypothetical protein
VNTGNLETPRGPLVAPNLRIIPKIFSTDRAAPRIS